MAAPVPGESGVDPEYARRLRRGPALWRGGARPRHAGRSGGTAPRCGPPAASAFSTSPKGSWRTPSGYWSLAWPSVGASDNRDWLQVIAAGLGAAYALHGHLTEGRALLEEALRESLRTGARGNRAFWVVRLSEVCRLAGRITEAWQYTPPGTRSGPATAGTRGRAHSRSTSLARSMPTPTLLISRRPNPLPAGARAGGGARDAPAPGALPPGPRLALREDSPARSRARAALSRAARRYYRRMAMTFWLPETEAALAQIEER